MKARVEGWVMYQGLLSLPSLIREDDDDVDDDDDEQMEISDHPAMTDPINDRPFSVKVTFIFFQPATVSSFDQPSFHSTESQTTRS